jgi:hypothetical protein
MALETEGLALDPPTVTRGVAALLASADKGFYLVAQDANSGAPAGQLMVTSEWSDWNNGGRHKSLVPPIPSRGTDTDSLGMVGQGTTGGFRVCMWYRPTASARSVAACTRARAMLLSLMVACARRLSSDLSQPVPGGRADGAGAGRRAQVAAVRGAHQ